MRRKVILFGILFLILILNFSGFKEVSSVDGICGATYISGTGCVVSNLCSSSPETDCWSESVMNLGNGQCSCVCYDDIWTNPNCGTSGCEDLCPDNTDPRYYYDFNEEWRCILQYSQLCDGDEDGPATGSVYACFHSTGGCSGSLVCTITTTTTGTSWSWVPEPQVKEERRDKLYETECNDGWDNDCNGVVDCAEPNCMCVDEDGDNFDICGSSRACDDGEPLDCNDFDPLVHPGATEIPCNEKDDDCVGGDDLNCGGECTDADTDGYNTTTSTECGTFANIDCNDTNYLINPGRMEICNDGVDNDCDTLADCSDEDCDSDPFCIPSGNSCGNNTIESGEECDGTDLNGETCASLDFGTGTLTCNPPGFTATECTFNTSGCSDAPTFEDCILLSASWSKSSVVNNTVVSLNILPQDSSKCEGAKIRYTIKEHNWGIIPDTTVYIFTNTFSSATPTNWRAYWMNGNPLIIPPWDPEYYFEAYPLDNSESKVESGILKVTRDCANPPCDEPPTANITGPIDKQIYFTINKLEFTHISYDLEDGLVSEAKWEFGGEVTIEGESGTFTEYTLTVNNAYNMINATYEEPGQKNIKLTVKDSSGQESSDQISILVIESPFVLAYISEPAPFSIQKADEGYIDINGQGGYVIEGIGDSTLNDPDQYNITCVAGSCPQETYGELGEERIPVKNWNTAPNLNTASFLAFNWSFSGISQTRDKWGNEEFSVEFKRFYDVGPSWVDLTLRYFNLTSGMQKASSKTRNEFMTTYDYTACYSSESEWYWVYPTGETTTSSCFGPEIDDPKPPIETPPCCSDGELCSSGSCETTTNFYCNDFDSLNSCENEATKWFARNSVRSIFDNDELVLGYILNDSIPGCEAFLADWWCEWDEVDEECNGKFRVGMKEFLLGMCGSGYNIGNCKFNENANPDGCVDGRLSYSWTAEWLANPPAPAYCQNGTRTIQCPARIQLDFIGEYQVAIIISLIIIIYILWMRKKK